MLSNLWIDSRKNNWNRLDALVHQVEASGVKSLPPSDLRDLGLLYRQAAADLSAIRADPSSRALAQYLNRLVSR
ncbi:MAG TPA: stage II sporulation protein M, partial [Acidobacteriaceae bacterium]